MCREIVLLQTCVPDYRIPVFSRISQMLPAFRVFAGPDFFTPEIRTKVEGVHWFHAITNSFVLGRRFLWQGGVLGPGMRADVLIAELNPRILSTWLLLCLRRLLRKRTLVWGHAWSREGVGSWTNKLRVFMARMSNGVICYSESQAGELRKRLQHTRITAAANSCVRQEDCGAIAGRTAAVDVVCVGRLDVNKKPRLLLDAFAVVAERLPIDAQLVFVGDGPERSALEDAVRQLGLEGRVCFRGHVSDIEILRSIYARAAVAVSPGYVGLSAIQCMAFGIPMLVSMSEPHAPEIEACVEGVTCQFFKTDDRHDLGEKLVEFVRNPAEWREREREIANWIRDRYTIDVMTEALIDAALGRREEHDRVSA